MIGLKKEFTAIVLGGLLGLLPVADIVTNAHAQQTLPGNRQETQQKSYSPQEREEYTKQVYLLSYVLKTAQSNAVIEPSYHDLIDAAIRAIVKKANPDAKYMSNNSAAREKDLPPKEQFKKNMLLAEHLILMAKGNATKEVTFTELVDVGLKAMLQSMDPHSVYMNAQERKIYEEESRGTFSGIGAELRLQGKAVRIQKVMEEQPAEKAGIREGDLITSVDGKPVESFDKDIMKVVQAIRGPEGTNVTLTIKREGGTEPLSFTIRRGRVDVNPVKTRIIETEKGRIGVIDLTTFSDTSHASFVKEVGKLKAAAENKIDFYVLNLRGNGGGSLYEVGKIADEMLDDGEVYSINTRDPQGNRSKTAVKGDILDGKPLIVLTDARSASASEILAGALKDNGRAIIMNPYDSTFGKGTGQNVMYIGTGEGMRLTTFYFATKSGSPHKVGVKPDIKVELSEAAKPKLVIPPDTTPEEAAEMKKAFDEYINMSESTMKNVLPTEESMVRHDLDPAQSCTVEETPGVSYTVARKAVEVNMRNGAGDEEETPIVDETLACAVEKLLGIQERATLKPYVKTAATAPAGPAAAP